MPVLDTTVLIADERDPAVHAFLVRLIAEGEPLMVPAQVAIEFAAGRPDPAEAIRKIRDAFVLVPCGPDIVLEASRMAKASLRAGSFPGWPDIQVAATARHEGMAVVTNNGRHFEPLGIRVRPHP